jgi:uncharacterized protein DUF4235
MKVAFLPISIIAGVLAGLLGRKTFEGLWGKVDDEEAPDPKHREVSMPKLVAALLLEGAIFRLAKGLVDHALRRGFARFTGTWPGEEEPEPQS